MNKFCIHCGAENLNVAHFCTSCGSKLDNGDANFSSTESIKSQDNSFFLFSFSGCISRQTYWAVTLGIFGVYMVLILILSLTISLFSKNPTMDSTASLSSEISSYQLIIIIALLIVTLLFMWINMVTSIKRLRDANFSAWWYLLNLIPSLGTFILFIINGFFPSVEQDNKYCKSRNNLSLKAVIWLHMFFWIPFLLFAFLSTFS